MGVKRNNEDLHKSPTNDSENLQVAKSSRITRQSNMLCKVCNEVTRKESSSSEAILVTCNTCDDRYHGKCVGIVSFAFYEMIMNSGKGWTCYGCKQDNFTYMRKMDERLDAAISKINSHAQQIPQMTQSFDVGFNLIESRVSSFEQRMTSEIEAMKKQLQEHGSNESNNHSGNSNRNSLTSDVTYVRDLQRKNNLIVQNIPPIDDENPMKLKQVMIKMANTCGYDLTPSDISAILRLRRQAPNNGSQRMSTHKSEAILVKFTDVTIKDEIFRGYIQNITNKLPITTASLGLTGNQRIYINQHLSSELVKVKMRAVKLKELKKISKVTACYNVVKILVDNEWKKVYNTTQLQKLFPDS